MINLKLRDRCKNFEFLLLRRTLAFILDVGLFSVISIALAYANYNYQTNFDKYTKEALFLFFFIPRLFFKGNTLGMSIMSIEFDINKKSLLRLRLIFRSFLSFVLLFHILDFLPILKFLHPKPYTINNAVFYTSILISIPLLSTLLLMVSNGRYSLIDLISGVTIKFVRKDNRFIKMNRKNIFGLYLVVIAVVYLLTLSLIWKINFTKIINSLNLTSFNHTNRLKQLNLNLYSRYMALDTDIFFNYVDNSKNFAPLYFDSKNFLILYIFPDNKNFPNKDIHSKLILLLTRNKYELEHYSKNRIDHSRIIIRKIGSFFLFNFVSEYRYLVFESNGKISAYSDLTREKKIEYSNRVYNSIENDLLDSLNFKYNYVPFLNSKPDSYFVISYVSSTEFRGLLSNDFKNLFLMDFNSR